MQKDIFLSSEGDAWYRRNKSQLSLLSESNDSICELIRQQELSPNSVLEIGCANGQRLNIINKVFGSNCHGIDVSSEAILSGEKNFQNVNLSTGSADNLKFEDEAFDLVIFGFCLYLCDRKDLFKIAAEADRVLKDKGVMIIKDFHPPFPYKNNYSHCDNIFSYKMDYSRLFTWNPAYSVFSTSILSHEKLSDRVNTDERVGLTLLYKNVSGAYPTKPSYL